jgi:four helix bundle protein
VLGASAQGARFFATRCPALTQQRAAASPLAPTDVNGLERDVKPEASMRQSCGSKLLQVIQKQSRPKPFMIRHAFCLETGVGVKEFRELVAWQLAHELKCEVVAFTAAGPPSRDFRYRDDIRASSASAPANISEGFGRFRPLEFARFLSIAKASLQETQNHLIDGHDRRYLDDQLFSRLWNLSKAAERVTTNLLRSKQRQADAERRKRSTLKRQRRSTL